MWLNKILMMCIALRCVSAEDGVTQLTFGFKNVFMASITANVIFFNEQSIRNNTMAFAGCNDYHNNSVLNCAIHLVVPTSEVSNEHVMCNSKYYLDEDRSVSHLLILKPLYESMVLFKWLVTDDKDPSNAPFVIVRVINMSSCELKDTKVPLGEEPHFHKPSIAVYDKTFDVFFRNKRLCGGAMCGETLDVAGNVINGPVSSYLPADAFENYAFVCPAESGSSSSGHFLLAAKILLVSSASGKAKQLMDFPTELENFAYACDYGYLGICWIESLNETHVNCRQFNSQGEQVMNTRVDLSYRLGSTMSVKNRRNGGLLLQTNECEIGDDEWCNENPYQLTFFVHMIDKNGQLEETVFDMENIYCQLILATGLDVKSNGDVCTTFGCLTNHYVPNTNANVRTIFYCNGKRNVTDPSSPNYMPALTAPVEEKTTKKPVKPSKPTKKKKPHWHV